MAKQEGEPLEPLDTAFNVTIPSPVAPRISTARLCLRQIKPSDAERLFAIRSQPEYSEYLWPKEPDKDINTTRQWIASKTFTAPESAAGLSFCFAITLADDPTGRIIGTVGVNHLVPYATIGYGIAHGEWGKGYATEAISAAVKAWWSLPRIKTKQGDDDLKGLDNKDGPSATEKLYAFCNVKNIGSFRALQKCGFRVLREQRMEVNEELVAIMGIDRPEAADGS
ncbi:hypothetical protein AJ80_06769 [Polytolypa hystricis UAMH7299]|uniref:N-acetyltransferase domain-containing protein n=1 Tax=Polytolypa hystricis (strain UAMH7299) TaxID=1447883 RepID=A0A2B7XTI4_POLH7|nr:hypothetical protein AJ80_06769 [Polytolypa hystricis UAMH7299]